MFWRRNKNVEADGAWRVVTHYHDGITPRPSAEQIAAWKAEQVATERKQCD